MPGPCEEEALRVGLGGRGRVGEDDAMDSSSRPSKGSYVLTEQGQGAEPSLSL
jgi:hypothetical protein